MENYFNMDGYGGYIWPAYGVSAGVLGVLTWLIIRRWRYAKRRLKEVERSHEPGTNNE